MNRMPLSAEDREKIISLRKELHQFPELAHTESTTKQILLKYLKDYGLKVTEVPNSSGFFADLVMFPGKNFVALRADMDGLPVEEENDIEFKSRNHGKMHACGHDGHMSIAFGTFLYLQKSKSLNKNLRLIFQPAEEEASVGGARELISAGALEKVDFIAGMHMWPEILEGKVGYRKGPFFSGLNKFKIIIKGDGTHAARPDLAGPNTIYVSNTLLTAITGFLQRTAYPWAPYTLNINKLEGSPKETTIWGIISHSVAPDESELPIQPGRRYEDLKTDLIEICTKTGESMGAEVGVTIQEGYPPLVTDVSATELAIEVIQEVLGKDAPIESSMTFGGEDFSLYLDKVQGTYLLLGVYNRKDGFTGMIHTPRFNFSDSVLIKGSTLMAELMLRASEL